MLEDQVKALNEFLSSIGIKETILQHEDFSITDRAFNVIHNPDDKDIVVIGGQKLDGAFGYILTIGTSQYAISADQYRRLEYFNRQGTVDLSAIKTALSAYSGVLEYEYEKHRKFSASPDYDLASKGDWNSITSIAHRILKKGNLRSVVLTSPIGSKTKFLKFKQTLPGLYKVLHQSSNRKGALKFNFIDGDSMTVMFVGNQPMILHSNDPWIAGIDCYPDVEVIDPLFDPVHGYMADNARRANENPYMRTRSGLFGESLKPRLVVKGTEHVDPNLGTALGYSPDLDEYVSETPYVRKDLTPEQLEQLQVNIEENHSDNRVGIIGTRDLKAGGIPMDAMNMLMAHKVIEK